ncbi:hypothetical protein [Streptomyces silaceus]|uniref:hypothetical protein n=1 Tax=Streptomyces silaceus TaxID=545123 RepID=UPI0006EB82A7|nr:hypothetical protein [Streptomyces silaceus]
MYESPSGRTPDLHAGRRRFAPTPDPQPIELYDEHDPIVHVPDPYDPRRSVAVRRSQIQAAAPSPPRDLRPLPLFDPMAQRLLGAGVGGGVLAAGVGWGTAQVVSAAAGGVTGLVLLVALVLLARMTGPRTTMRISQHVVNHNRGFGRSTTNL